MRLSGEILIGESGLQARVEALARAIAADTQDGGELSVIALMDGAFMFCADLVRRLPMPVRLALVPIKSIDRGGNPSALVLPDELRVLSHEIERSLVFEDSPELDFEQLIGAGSTGGPTPGGGLVTGWFNEQFRFPELGFSLEDAILRLIHHALAQSCRRI
jgi:hypothetical protein